MVCVCIYVHMRHKCTCITVFSSLLSLMYILAPHMYRYMYTHITRKPLISANDPHYMHICMSFTFLSLSLYLLLSLTLSQTQTWCYCYTHVTTTISNVHVNTCNITKVTTANAAMTKWSVSLSWHVSLSVCMQPLT